MAAGREAPSSTPVKRRILQNPSVSTQPVEGPVGLNILWSQESKNGSSDDRMGAGASRGYMRLVVALGGPGESKNGSSDDRLGAGASRGDMRLVAALGGPGDERAAVGPALRQGSAEVGADQRRRPEEWPRWRRAEGDGISAPYRTLEERTPGTPGGRL
ncbi:hypothetical protein NDU88_007207 [Pleurodeles waltl]|uniref:Uncharacterized protein n=1 Tax=Pleurodeles waltl TaxID=8319 RepID=A0AAV7RR24_PLEWA|nr:hypothetical protein NDU88_007207 [Pleurodeles waltl]